MEGGSGVTRSMIDERHAGDIQGYHEKGGGGVNQSIIDDLHFSDIQGDQIEGERVVT